MYYVWPFVTPNQKLSGPIRYNSRAQFVAILVKMDEVTKIMCGGTSDKK